MEWYRRGTLVSALCLALMGVATCVYADDASAKTADSASAKTALVYKNDFSDPAKFEKDSEGNNGLKYYDGVGLSSADASGGFITYDLQKLLPGAPAGAQFVLTYAGGVVGPDYLRGAHWSSSDDAKTWKEFSVNQFSVPKPFSGRYLKLLIKWQGAGGPDYGKVTSFSVKVKQDVSAAEKRTTYTDSFDNGDKFAADAIADNGLEVYGGLGLSSSNQGGGFATYEIANLLPGIGKDDKITLKYSGGVNGPPEMRGVRWSVSNDGKAYTEFSVNEFGKDIAVPPGLYLKVFVQWKQASGPDYGFLKSFTLTTGDKK